LCGFAQDHNIHTPVFGTAFRCGVGNNRPVSTYPTADMRAGGTFELIRYCKM